MYKITNIQNGKVYIGYTTRTAEARWKQHVNSAFIEQKDGSYNDHFKRAIRKYGEESFIVSVIEESDNKYYLQDRERYWIKYYRSYDGFKDSNGYNMTLGGQGGNSQYQSIYAIDPITGDILELFHSERDAISKYKTNVTAVVNQGDKPYLCNRISFMKKEEVDKLTSDELLHYLHKRYNVFCQFDLMGNYIKCYLYAADAERETGISKSALAQCANGKRKRAGEYQWCWYKDFNKLNGHKTITDGFKPVAQYDLSGQLIDVYNSIKEASELTGNDSSCITKVCKGKRATAGNCTWKYIYDCDDDVYELYKNR